MAVAGALAAPVAALAQVTVYGSVDAGVKNQSKVIVGAGDLLHLDESPNWLEKSGLLAPPAFNPSREKLANCRPPHCAQATLACESPSKGGPSVARLQHE